MDINNRIVTTWQARAGNVLSVLGQVENSMLRGGRAAGYQTRQLGAMEQQMRALGTTIRYALAGAAVFGITGLVGKLNQLQQQLGLIAAIGPTAGVKFGGQDGSIGQFLTEIEQQAVAARTPVQDLNNSVINFLSTVQGAPKSQIPEIVGQIGIAAKLSQTPTEDLTKAVTTLNIAAGRPNNLKTINALLREWFHLISSAPGGLAAAPQIAQQLGPLAAVSMRLGGRMTPEQMFGVALGTLRFGATPSVGLRGAQYLLQSLFQPQSKESTVALRAAGFTPQRLQQEGGARFLLDFLNYVRNLGARPTGAQARQYGNMVDLNPDETAAFDPSQTVPGLSPRASRFLGRAIGRIHGVRAAVTLIAQLDRTGQLSSLPDVITAMDNLNKNVGKDADELNKAVRAYQRGTPLQAAAIALNTLSTQLQTAIQPVTNPLARQIARAGDAAARHPHETRIAFGAAATLIAALGVRRFLGGGGSIFNRLRGLRGGAGQTFVTGQAIQDLATGGAQLGGSPTHPMYVIVVGNLFGQGGAGGTPGGGTPVPPGGAVTTAEKTSTLGRVVRAGAKYGGITAAAYFGSEAFVGAMEALGAGKHGAGGKRIEFMQFPKTAFPIGHYQWFDPVSGTFMKQRRPGERVGYGPINPDLGKIDMSSLTPSQRRQLSPILSKWAQGQMKDNVDLTKALLSTIIKSTKEIPKQEVTGGVDLNIKIDDGSGKAKDARVHIPLSTVHDGGRVPVSRGKRKSMRVDFTVGGTNIRVGGRP